MSSGPKIGTEASASHSITGLKREEESPIQGHVHRRAASHTAKNGRGRLPTMATSALGVVHECLKEGWRACEMGVHTSQNLYPKDTVVCILQFTPDKFENHDTFEKMTPTESRYP